MKLNCPECGRRLDSRYCWACMDYTIPRRPAESEGEEKCDLQCEMVRNFEKTTGQQTAQIKRQVLENATLEAVVDLVQTTADTHKAYKAECEKDSDSPKARALIMGFWHSWDAVSAALSELAQAGVADG